MKFKHVVTAKICTDDLLEVDFFRIWLGELDLLSEKGYMELFRSSLFRTKVNIWLAEQTGKPLEKTYICKMKFYFGVFGRRLVIEAK